MTDTEPAFAASACAWLPYHAAIVDFLKRTDPKVWDWFAKSTTDPKGADEVKFELLKATYRIEQETHAELYQTAGEVAQRLGVAAPVTIYQAQNPQGLNASIAFVPDATSDPSAVTVTPDSAASIAGISAAPTVWDSNGQVVQMSLTADALGDAQLVSFFNSDDGSFNDANFLGYGTQGANGWTLNSVYPTGSPTETFFAVATDSNWISTDPVALTIGPATIGTFSATPHWQTSLASATLTLSAGDLIDFSSAPASVSFYQDTSGTGVFNSATATLLGTANSARRWERSGAFSMAA